MLNFEKTSPSLSLSHLHIRALLFLAGGDAGNYQYRMS